MKFNLKTKLAAAALASAALAAPVIAQDDAPTLPGQMAVSRITAGTYTADPLHTLVGFRVNHFGFNDYFGIFGGVEGTLQIDPSNLSAASVDVTIPVADVTVAAQGLKDHLLRAGEDGGEPDFFGPSPAPARFQSTSVALTGETTANIAGNLTLNGVTRPVVVAARFTGAGANPMNSKLTVGFEGTTTIQRSNFGIDAFIPMVSDEVELDITAAFEKQ
ncbi:YceI family protein [Croceicoccus marinus]|uniref:Polyisoprenoid-binding protein n=1 Tax=Croceicoccus marinus TaxID=450378 RepID=A0A7G6VRA4_9SPHN|nr:YceI family protein [Croceicoccus marinus]QNE04269.1 polyisoprenoid-binding protein [Croceicoccus marinus]